MINVDDVLDIVETTFWTGVLDKEKPLSLLLIARVGSGKTVILQKAYKAPKVHTEFKETKTAKGKTKKDRIQSVEHIGSVLYTTDSTPYTLYNRWGELLLSGQIKHIVIPDFLSVLTKPKEVMADSVRFFNSLIEEGVCRIESRYSAFITEIPVQMGLVTAVSSQDYEARSKAQRWGAVGFLSRILPLSYHYSDGTKKEIQHFTFLREYHKENKFELELPLKPIFVEVPKEYEGIISRLGEELKDENEETAARRIKQLLTFVMASALKRGRDMVNKEDIERLQSYARFFNSECKAEL